MGSALLVLVLSGAKTAVPALFGERAGAMANDIRRQLGADTDDNTTDPGSGSSSSGSSGGHCDLSPPLGDFDNNGGVVLWILGIIYVFIGIAVICDDYFVESLEEICNVLKLPADVAGATFMAAGSSAPELATVVISTLIEPGDEGLGDVVGAAVFNSMTIVGASAIFAGQVLAIKPFPFTRDITFYLLSILLLAIFVSDGQIDWWEGLLLLSGYAAYITFMVYNTKIAMAMQAYGNSDKEPSTASGRLTKQLTRRLSAGYLEPQFDEDGNALAEQSGFSRQKSEVTSTKHDEQQAVNGIAVKNGATPPPSPPPSPPVIVSADSVELNPKDAGQAIEISVKVKGHKNLKLLGSPSTVNMAKAVLEARPVDKSSADALGMKEEDDPVTRGGGYGYAVTPSRAQGSMDSEPPSIATTLADLNVEGFDPEDEGPTTFSGKLWKVLTFPYVVLFKLTMPPCLQRALKDKWYLWLFSGSIMWIAILTYCMLTLCHRVGCVFGIPGVVMGLVFISAGTTVPDFLSSIIVAKEGQGDMAICNAIGSNIFNIFAGLGLPWFLYTVVHGKAYVSPALQGNSAIVPIVLLFAYVWVLPIVMVASGWKLYAKVGIFLICMHIAFLVFALLTNSINADPVIKLPGWDDAPPAH